MTLLFRPREFFLHETVPSDNASDTPEETTGGASNSTVSADDFARFQQTVNERFDSIGQTVNGFGQQITEGFGWVRENLAPVASPADDAVPDSPSENPLETVIEVQDRLPVANRKPRVRLDFKRLFR